MANHSHPNPASLAARPAASNSGFSLIEVIVALAVAASLTMVYISTQQQSIAYIEDIDDRLEHVSIAQEYLIKNPFFTQHTPTLDWIGEETGKQWRILVEQDEDLFFVSLQTRYKESIMTWDWVRQ